VFDSIDEQIAAAVTEARRQGLIIPAQRRWDNAVVAGMNESLGYSER
jgi:hypothetical protein